MTGTLNESRAPSVRGCWECEPRAGRFSRSAVLRLGTLVPVRSTDRTRGHSCIAIYRNFRTPVLRGNRCLLPTAPTCGRWRDGRLPLVPARDDHSRVLCRRCVSSERPALPHGTFRSRPERALEQRSLWGLRCTRQGLAPPWLRSTALPGVRRPDVDVWLPVRRGRPRRG